MIYVLIFLYVTLMYLKYILHSLENTKTPIDILPIGLLIGSFSIFLVHLLSPHNYLNYAYGHLVLFDIVGDRAIATHVWPMAQNTFDILRHYLFTGFTEEICKLSAGYLIFMLYKKITLQKLYFYIIMSASFFAFIENIGYLETYGPRVLIVRSIFSTTIHISLGMILGYFLIRYLKQKNKLKSIAYMAFGFCLAVFIHGSFNYTATHEMEALNILVWMSSVGIGIYLLQRVKKYFI